MNFMAVGNRCALDIGALELTMSDAEALYILGKLGFAFEYVDVVALARSRVYAATYQRGVKMELTPHVFDCSSLVKWVYGQKWIWLPRHSISQASYIPCEVSIAEAQCGDLLFTSGRQNYYWTDPALGIGHVGIMTERNTVIHAASTIRGIVEDSIEDFLESCPLRTVRRVSPQLSFVLTVISGEDWIVEYSESFRWIVLGHLDMLPVPRSPITAAASGAILREYFQTVTIDTFLADLKRFCPALVE